MTIFVFYIIITFCWGLLLLYTGRCNSANKKAYFVFLGSNLFLMSALRDETVGTDTLGYVAKFKDVASSDFASILTISKDKGFYVFIKLLSFISSSPRFHLAVLAVIFAVSISIFIWKYSKEPAFSYFSLLPFNLVYFSMTGLRQALALSVLLFAYPYIIKRKPIQFLLIVLLAAMFHKTALFFLLAYLTRYYKLNSKSVCFLIVIMAATYLFRYQVVNFITQFADKDRSYEVSGGSGGMTTLVMYLGILAFGLFFQRNIQKNDPGADVMYNMVVLGIVFQTMTPIINEFFRLSMYFNVMNIIFIPNVIHFISDRHIRTVSYVGAVSLLTILYLFFTYDDAGIYPYLFFWDK